MNCKYTIALLISAFPLCGCAPPADSWKDYLEGHGFRTIDPCYSSDGHVLVFASPISGHGDIYAFYTHDRNFVRLTSGPEFESSPVLSPDGTHLVFERQADGNRHIWRMNPDGTGLRQLTFGSINDNIESAPTNSHIVIARDAPNIGLGRKLDKYTVALDDSSVRKATPKKWSPASSSFGNLRLYEEYNRDARRSEVWLADSRSGTTQLLGQGVSFRFSPAGKRAYFWAPEGFRSVSLEGGPSHIVKLPTAGESTGLRYSDDGRQAALLVNNSKTGDSQLVLIDTENASAITLPVDDAQSKRE